MSQTGPAILNSKSIPKLFGMPEKDLWLSVKSEIYTYICGYKELYISDPTDNCVLWLFERYALKA